jgi:hypothetical protein
LSYVLLGLLNVLILAFVYYKFIAAIRKNAEVSIKNYKVEAARTVDAFNKEFDRNLTILENRSQRLDTLLSKSEEYINSLVDIEKHLDINKTTSLILEVKEQLEALELQQRKLKENLSKERVHLNIKNNHLIAKEKAYAPEVFGEEEKQEEKLFQDEIEKQLPKTLSHSDVTVGYDDTIHGLGEETEIIDKESLLKAFNVNIKKKEESNIGKNAVVEKAYKKSFPEDEKDETISRLLEKALDQGENKNDKESFKDKLEKKIAREFLYSDNDTHKEDRDNKENQSSSLSSVQNEVFNLLDAGKSISEICDILSISKGAAELHLHIHKMRKIAE